MRCLALTTAVAVGLLALACTDEREAPTEPSTKAAASPCPSSDPIQSQICALFRSSDNLASASDFYNNVKIKVRQGRTADAQARAADLVNFTFKQYYADRLQDPNGTNPPTIPGGVVQLTCDVLDYVGSGWADCEADLGSGLTSTSSSPHSTIQVCGPAGCLVRPEDKHSGVSVPPEACPTVCIISVDPIPPNHGSPRDGPLSHLTNLDQYPLFRELKLFASFDEFAVPVLVGICHLSPNDGGPFAPPDAATEQRLQLAHPDPNNPEGIEILAKVNAPFLDCSDLFASNDEFTPPIIGGRSLYWGGFASAAETIFRRAVGPVLQALLPEAAEAAVLGSCCLGGTTTKFSPWAAVDPESGPTTTGTSLTSSSSLAIVGAPLTLTATVSPAPPTNQEPAVEFFDGTTSIGTGYVNSDGIAEFITSSLSLVQHSLTAQFLGTSTHGASTSSTLVQNMVQRYTDLSSFNAVIGGTELAEDFNSLDVGTPISSIIDGVLNVTSPFASLEVWTDFSLFGIDESTRLNGEGRYDLMFVATSMNALAFDVVAKDPLTGPAKAVVTAGGGSAEFSVQNISESESDPVFLGFIASTPFTSAALIEGPERGGSTTNEEVSLDNFLVDAVSLPLPPIVLLQ